MKNFLAILLCCIFAFSMLTACGDTTQMEKNEASDTARKDDYKSEKAIRGKILFEILEEIRSGDKSNSTDEKDQSEVLNYTQVAAFKVDVQLDKIAEQLDRLRLINIILEHDAEHKSDNKYTRSTQRNTLDGYSAKGVTNYCDKKDRHHQK